MNLLEPTYQVIRSRRRTMAIEVTVDGRVLVRIPSKTTDRQVEEFVKQHRDWIARALERQHRRRIAHPEPDAQQRANLRYKAEQVLPTRVAYYAAMMGVQPISVRITDARTRFGSCSAKNALCFSWRLMQYPQEAVDYVVVHELAHIIHKNHGPHFWALVEQYMPDYQQRRMLLRE